MKAKLTLTGIMAVLALSCASYAQDRFGGIGLVAAMHQDALTVIQVLTNTPASRAGITPGLVVQKIDRTPTQGKRLKECIDLMRGAPGTKVRLELVDTDKQKTNSVELVRENIAVKAGSRSNR